MTLFCVLSLGFASTGCAIQAPAPTGDEDSRDAIAITSGKSDGSSYSQCELDELTAMVNDLDLTTLDDERPARDALRAEGVHGSAAKCIVWWRLGVDTDVRCRGTNLPAGFTPAVREFPDAQAIDAVKYVGPSAFRALGAIGTAACAALPPPGATTDVIFSPTDELARSHAARIINLMDNAERSIDISMYSFSQNDIKQALLRNASRLSVRVLYDRGHLGSGLENALERAGIEVRRVGQINHHKYAIFDGVLAAGDDPAAATISSGSANWSNGAVGTYDESTVFVSNSPELALRYQREFNLLWRHSTAVETGADSGTNYFDSVEITDAMIEAVEDPTVDAAFTSMNFRVTSRGLSVDKRNGYQMAQRWIDLIEGAEESIWLYSERLRSVPVANALLAVAEANPDLEIRIYQDNQEYVTAYKTRQMLSRLDNCYAGATTNTQRINCERGVVYSQRVAEAFEASPNHQYRLKYYSYNWHYSFQQMHHKSMIIDGRWIVTGSYNLSYNAEFNTFENVMFFDGEAHPALLASFTSNFEAAWNRGADDYATMMTDVTSGTTTVPIRFVDRLGLEPMSLTWQQVDDYRTAARAACGGGELYQLGRDDERAMTCVRQ